MIDLEANLGLFSALAAEKRNRVYAFEPIPNTVRLLKSTQQLYNNIEIVQKAAGAKRRDEVAMTNSPYLGQNRILRYHFDNRGSQICVPMITLDDFAAQKKLDRIDFIKADIEGSECEMIQGAARILRQYGPMLSLCTYHNSGDAENMEKLIKEANPRYTVIHRWKKLFAYI